MGEEESAADSVVMSGAVTLLTSQSTTSTNDATGLVFFDQSFASLAAFCLSRELVGGKNPIERRCKTAAKINLVNVHENENENLAHEPEPGSKLTRVCPHRTLRRIWHRSPTIYPPYIQPIMFLQSPKNVPLSFQKIF